MKTVNPNKNKVTKMDGEKFLSEMPKKNLTKSKKVSSKKIDGEKFLSTTKKIKSFESFINEDYKAQLKKLDDKLDNLLDTKPSNKKEEKEQKELIKEIEDEINQIKIDRAEVKNEGKKDLEFIESEKGLSYFKNINTDKICITGGHGVMYGKTFDNITQAKKHIKDMVEKDKDFFIGKK